MILSIVFVTGAGGAAPQKAKHENFDSRSSSALLVEGSGSPEWWKAGDNVRERVREVRIDQDEVTGAAKFVGSTQEFLTGAQGEGGAVSPAIASAIPASEEHRGVKAFLNEHRNLFGHGAEALDGARVERDDKSPHSGMRTVVWHQMLDGIPVFEGVLKAHTTSRGELINLGSQFVGDPASAADKGSAKRRALQAKPEIPAQEAVAIAARRIDEEVQAADIEPRDKAQGEERSQRFRNPKLIDPSARLTWFPLDPKTLRLCWDVVLMSKAQAEMFRMLVDAQTGEVLLRRSLTEHLSDASYRVFTSDSPTPFSPGWSMPNSGQPASVTRTLVTTPALDTTASPNGWINDGVNETVGNNVDAHLDVNADNQPDLPRPQGSPNRVFDFALDLTQDPATTVNQSAAVVQLFYWCNWMHDKLYELGFTEAAGNFQTSNFGRGGWGNDAVQADAQDGSGTNNSNFSTPSDGISPRMQMYIFTGPSPHRDACFDAEIVLHEYTHGLSNRLVGGGVGISALQTRGMGEGWSDFYATALLSQAGDNVDGNYAAGAYCTYKLSGMTQNYYYGIRRYPYSTDMTKNPLTFKDIDPTRYSTHSGVPMSPITGNYPSEVHCQGEVWCVTLWEARANLINQYGWATGNQLILQLVTDGMKLAPANPTFLQARDAILQADLVDNGGANKNLLWAAFAKRGMGKSAIAPANSTTTGVTEAFDVPNPNDLNISPATSFNASGFVGGPFTPASSVYTIANSGTGSITWSAAKTQPWLTLSATGGTLASGTSTTLTVSINSSANSLVSGSYSDTVTFTNVSTGSGNTTRAVSLLVSVPPPSISSALTATGTNGSAFSYQITASNSPTSYSATSLPSGLSVDTASGLISGTPTQTGTFNATISATNVAGTGSATLALTIVPPAPVITSALTATGTSGAPFSYQITATNTPTSYSATGLPDGLSVDTATGLISGTPTLDGTFNATINATNSGGTGSAPLALTVLPMQPPVITSSSTVTGASGIPFHYQITATYGPTSYDATDLPSGLSVNPATGLISGTPAQTGTFNATISASNPVGTGSAILVLTIALPPPPVITSASTVSGTFNATFSYQITASNYPASYDATGLPPGLSVDTAAGLISGTPTQTGTFNATLNAVNVGGAGSAMLTLTIKAPTLVAWGSNTYGQTTVPTGLKNVVAIAGGFYHSLAVKSDGTVTGWGSNASGQTSVPTGLNNAVAISAGGFHSLALKSDGTVTAWGVNAAGQTSVPKGLNNVVAISAGGFYSLALKSDETVVAWGSNDYGQAAVPPGLFNVVAIAAGYYHSLALKSDGTVVAWGRNNYGQATVPTDLNNVVAVAGGGNHSLALKSDGTVVAWGLNDYGQTSVPTDLNNVVAIAAGGFYSLALKSDGTVVAWGQNTSSESTVPTGLSNVVEIAAGSAHGLALTEDDSSASPPVIISSLKALGSLSPFQYRIVAKNSPVSFDVTGLPSGLSVDPATGLISGTPTQTGTFNTPISAANPVGTGSATLILTILPPPPVITSALTATGSNALAFGYQITATNSPTSYGATGLPAGLSVDTATGLISGAPTQTGTFNATISASNAGGTGSATLALTIILPPPAITSALTATGNNGLAFSYQITASNNPTSYDATGLPPGLSVDPATGLISGTPTQMGTFNTTLSATNASGSGSATLVLTILVHPPVITSPVTKTSTVGFAFSYQITANNSPTSFNATGLPVGLSVDPATGLISGTPTQTGTFNAPISATNAGGTGSATLILTILPPPPVITSALTATGSNALAFSYQITATNSPTSYGASGLPAGLSVNTATGLISGTPTQMGTFNTTLGATNASGSGSATLVLTILMHPPVITSAVTKTSPMGVAFSYQITASNSPTSFNATGLPAGLSVNTATGLISGTATQPGTFNTPISATNAGGTGSATLVMTILPPAPSITSALSKTGTNGSALSYQITATNSPTSYGASGLPSGLSVNTATGLISGAPTQTGTFNASISATNTGGTGSATLVLTVLPSAPVITSALTATGNNGAAFSYQITASNSPTSYGASGLPSGLSVNTATGLISGTPTQTGTFNSSISATNGQGTGSATLVLTVRPPLPIITSALAKTGTNGTAFSYQITASSSPTSFNATGLPSGLGVDPATGLISGTPTQTGTFNAPISATNTEGTGSATLVLTILPPPPVITSPLSRTGTNGSALSYQITATNSPTSYGATSLPPGLSVNTATGLISGTAIQVGTFNATISATNVSGSGSATLAFTILMHPPVITSALTATGTNGAAFSYQITASNSPTSFNATNLPSGLSVNTTSGLISGTPTQTGTFSATLSATNSGGAGSAAWVLTVAPPPPPSITSALTKTGTFGAAFSYQITATNSPTSYGATGLLPGLNVNTSTGLISGTPTQIGGFNVSISASNVWGTGTAALNIAVPPVVVWGLNSYALPAGLSSVIKIAGGSYHSLALKPDGTVAAWGDNAYGQSTVPTGLSNVAAIANGGYHSLALKSDGTVTAWGYNTSGQTTVPTGLSNVTAIAGGGFHSLALKTDGTVVAWGQNSSGQSTVPTGLNNVVAIAGGNSHSLALKSDGTVVAWGLNTSAQATVPTGLSNVTAIAAGYSHSLALKSDGTVVAWGLNTSGQATVPTGLSNVVAIAAGNNHSLALKSDGTVVAWGLNSYGQATVPTGLGNIVAIAGGGSFSLALKGPPPVITSALTATGTNGAAFGYQITAINNPTSYSASGLPSGLSVDTALGLISGTPTQTGTFNVILSAINASGAGSVTLTLTVVTPSPPVITSALTATGTNGAAFGYQITATNNPTSYSATGLPDGLSVDTVLGLISGTPTQTGTFNATLNATNAGGTGSAAFALSVLPPPLPVITSSTTASGGSGILFSYQITATNSPTSYDATGLPDGLSVDISTGLISGIPTQQGTFSITLSAINAWGTGSATLSLTIGADAVFTVSPSGAGPFTFQWQILPNGGATWSDLHDRSIYSGVATAALTIAAPTAAMNGDQFRCIMTDPNGSVASDPVKLVVSKNVPALPQGMAWVLLLALCAMVGRVLIRNASLKPDRT